MHSKLMEAPFDDACDPITEEDEYAVRQYCHHDEKTEKDALQASSIINLAQITFDPVQWLSKKKLHYC